MRIILLRSGTTDFDDEGRIKGTLDIPLNVRGTKQAVEAASSLADKGVDIVYFSPCQSAQQTATVVADGLGVKTKSLKNLQNMDHGLWQGKLVDELREKQKKVYRQAQEQPHTVCPPQGESVSDVQVRVKTVLDKLIKKHKNQVVVLVAPEPLMSLLHCYLQQTELEDFWEAVCDCGSWLPIDVEPQQVATMEASR